MDGCSRIFWSSITASYFQTLFKCKIKISEKRPWQLFVFFPLIKQPPHSSGDPTEGSDPYVGNHCACRPAPAAAAAAAAVMHHQAAKQSLKFWRKTV